MPKQVKVDTTTAAKTILETVLHRHNYKATTRDEIAAVIERVVREAVVAVDKNAHVIAE